MWNVRVMASEVQLLLAKALLDENVLPALHTLIQQWSGDVFDNVGTTPIRRANLALMREDFGPAGLLAFEYLRDDQLVEPQDAALAGLTSPDDSIIRTWLNALGVRNPPTAVARILYMILRSSPDDYYFIGRT